MLNPKRIFAARPGAPPKPVKALFHEEKMPRFERPEHPLWAILELVAVGKAVDVDSKLNTARREITRYRQARGGRFITRRIDSNNTRIWRVE